MFICSIDLCKFEVIYWYILSSVFLVIPPSASAPQFGGFLLHHHQQELWTALKADSSEKILTLLLIKNCIVLFLKMNKLEKFECERIINVIGLHWVACQNHTKLPPSTENSTYSAVHWIYSQLVKTSLSCKSSVALLWKCGELFFLGHSIVLALRQDNT